MNTNKFSNTIWRYNTHDENIQVPFEQKSGVQNTVAGLQASIHPKNDITNPSDFFDNNTYVDSLNNRTYGSDEFQVKNNGTGIRENSENNTHRRRHLLSLVEKEPERTLKNIIESIRNASANSINEWIELGLYNALFSALSKIPLPNTFLISQFVKAFVLTDLKQKNRFTSFFTALYQPLCSSTEECRTESLLFVLYSVLMHHSNNVEYSQQSLGKYFLELSGINFLLDFYSSKIASAINSHTTHSNNSSKITIIGHRTVSSDSKNTKTPQHKLKKQLLHHAHSYSSILSNRLRGTKDFPAHPDFSGAPLSLVISSAHDNSINNTTDFSSNNTFVPKLTIPVNQNVATPSLSRTSRRMNHDVNYMNFEYLGLSFDTQRTRSTVSEEEEELDDGLEKSKQPKLMKDYFSSLAAKLGELYIAPHLTDLIAIKRDIDKKSELPSNDYTKDDNQVTGKLTPKLSSIEKHIQSGVSPHLIQKNLTLKLLNYLLKFPNARKLGRSPINMILFELNSAEKVFDYEDIIEQENRDLMYSIMGLYAEDVEAKYFTLWRANNRIDPTKDAALKKFDIFLWRWTGIVEQLLEQEMWDEIAAQLLSLTRYLRSCNSRVHASQCCAVCLEVLLKIQNGCRSRCTHREHGIAKYFFAKKVESVIIHYLLEIFDFIIDSPEHHPLLMEFFYFNLIDNETNFKWIKEYAQHVFRKDDPTLTTNTDSNDDIITLQDRQSRVIKHFSSLMNLFQELGEEFIFKHSYNIRERVINSISGGEIDCVVDSSDIANAMKRFEFLVNPVDGIVLEFLTRGPNSYHYDVKKEILSLLQKIFRIPHLPFLRNESYVNSYIRYHFLNFVKLYISTKHDPQTIELCNLHLKVLISFSVNKTPEIVKRFLNMKAVHFLTREIDLEYEMFKNRDKTHCNITSDTLKNNINYNENSDPNDQTTEETDGEEEEDDEDEDEGTETERSDDENNVDSPSFPSNAVPSVKPPLLKIGNLTGNNPKIQELNFVTKSKLSPLNIPLKENENTPNNNSQTAANFTKISHGIPHNNNGVNGNNNNQNTNSENNDDTEIDDDDDEQQDEKNVMNLPQLNSNRSNQSIKKTTPRVFQNSEDGTIIMNQQISARRNTKATSEPSSAEDTHTNISDSEPEEDEVDDDESKDDSPMPPTTPLKPMIPGLVFGSQNPKMPSIPKITGMPKLGDENKPTTSNEEDKALSEQEDMPSPVSTLTPRSEISSSVKYEEEELDTLYSSRKIIGKEAIFMNRAETSDSKYFDFERKNRKIYSNDDLHISFLSLLMSLLITNNQTLDPQYADQNPAARNLVNIPFLLHCHLNDPSNDPIIAPLHQYTLQELGLGSMILLRLVCKKLFEPSLYSKRIQHIARGGYGDVWRCEIPVPHSSIKSVAVKLLAVPTDMESRCIVHDIFTEILVMEKFKGDDRICRLYDYGVDNNYYYIVMKGYKCSLRKWRKQQGEFDNQDLPIYMNIYRKILEQFKFLSESGVHHFDIKAENIFIEPYEGVSEENFWKQKTEIPNFHMVLGDFGESFVFGSEQESYTSRQRGTICIRSPEMIEELSQKSRKFDRRKRAGAGGASDVWSLGCLFYELMSGDFLFDADDEHYPMFRATLTTESMTLISQPKYMVIHYNSILNDILMYILVRNPVRRPSITDILTKYTEWTKLIPSLEKLKQSKGNHDEESQAKAPISPVKKVFTPEQDETNLMDLSNSYAFTTRFATTHRALEFRKKTMSNFPKAENLPSKFLSPNKSNFQLSYPWSKDTLFYIERESTLIRNRIYISSETVALNKRQLNQLGITHIVNYSTSDFPFDDNFFHFPIKSHLTSPELFQEYLKGCSFVLRAVKQRGKVLIYSGKGLSAACLFAVFFIMQTYRISSYEAYLYVKSRRPAILPDVLSNFLNFIFHLNVEQNLPKHKLDRALGVIDKLSLSINHTQDISMNKKRVESVHWYRCICGMCVFGILSPFYPFRLNPINIEDDVSPLKTWPSVLEEMRLLYFYETKGLNLGMTTLDKVYLDTYDLANFLEEHQTTSAFGASKSNVNYGSHNWRVFRCKNCGFFTHAVKRQEKQQQRQKLQKAQSSSNLEESPSSNVGQGTISRTLSATGIPSVDINSTNTESNIPFSEVEVAVNTNLRIHTSTVSPMSSINDYRPLLFFRGTNVT